MQTQELQYHLPEERIAQVPAKRRDESRLLVHDRSTGNTTHRRFHELPDFLPSGTRIFRNDVSVIKAQLQGERPTGGKVECLLLRPDKSSATTWRCLLKPGAKTEKAGSFSLSGQYEAFVVDKCSTGEYLVRFDLPRDPDVHALAERLGTMPLPPYVRRPADESDEKRYQTVYADPSKHTAVAAPTAGLHFTTELLDHLNNNGHRTYDLTLSVGAGTFRPIETKRVEDHVMHAETYSIPSSTRIALSEPTPPRLAVGTTTARAVEHHLGQTEDGSTDAPVTTETDLFICPPYAFRGVDILLTNFHLPESTLLCLVAAFLSPDNENGLPLLKEIYDQALSLHYNFYSYGDAMLIL